ncbi:hypothetical protein OESDEN_20476 [Oesophagostomum dentatum]|uniref:Uncharacterized protein n=1 Tax=Oesophagostomum dentatum TaxID=61180 RepID=A0A0B1S4J7_OESDE|nr:hypothetical protein OESDEN_20476 [Oesophagostomum dentatum]
MSGRQAINVSDVALLMRRNHQLLDMVCKNADIDLGDYERPVTKRQRSSNKETAKSKRGSRASRPGTALGAPPQRSGTSTPRSDVDGNSRSSPFDKYRKEAIAEEKTPTVMKTVEEEDFDDDVMVVDYEQANANSDKKSCGDRQAGDGNAAINAARSDVKATASILHPSNAADVVVDDDEDDFSMLDAVVPATSTPLPVPNATTPVSKGLTLRRSARKTFTEALSASTTNMTANKAYDTQFDATNNTPKKNPHNAAAASNVRIFWVLQAATVTDVTTVL